MVAMVAMMPPTVLLESDEFMYLIQQSTMYYVVVQYVIDDLFRVGGAQKPRYFVVDLPSDPLLLSHDEPVFPSRTGPPIIPSWPNQRRSLQDEAAQVALLQVKTLPLSLPYLSFRCHLKRARPER